MYNPLKPIDIGWPDIPTMKTGTLCRIITLSGLFIVTLVTLLLYVNREPIEPGLVCLEWTAPANSIVFSCTASF